MSIIGQPVRSSPIIIEEGLINPNLKRITLIGYLKDGTQAPRKQLENIEWEISNPSIGKIENGYFIPLQDGQTEIIAKLQTRDGTIISTSAIVTIGELLLDRIIISERSLSIVPGTLIDVYAIE